MFLMGTIMALPKGLNREHCVCTNTYKYCVCTNFNEYIKRKKEYQK